MIKHSNRLVRLPRQRLQRPWTPQLLLLEHIDQLETELGDARGELSYPVSSTRSNLARLVN
jgi:hypothetical protein